MQPEQVRNASGGDGVGRAGGEIGVDGFGFAGEKLLRVIGVADADEDAGVAAREARAGMAGVFEGLPGGFEQQPLLRIHAPRFFGGDAEEAAVEHVDSVEEGAPARGHFAGRFGIGIVPLAGVPAVGGDFADQIASVAQGLPEGLRIAGATGHPAGHTDDGQGRRNGVAGGSGRFEGLDLLIELRGEQREALRRQVGNAIEEFFHLRVHPAAEHAVHLILGELLEIRQQIVAGRGVGFNRRFGGFLRENGRLDVIAEPVKAGMVKEDAGRGRGGGRR